MSSSEASQHTQRRRRDNLIGHRETISGGKEKAQGQDLFRIYFFFPPEQNIQIFLEFYRERFDASFTPKLHLLEDHVVPFLRKWRVGFGFHGEQGAESLHASFNKIGESYVAIHDAVKRLQCVVREHHLQVSPTMLAQQPAVKKRRTL